jgi:Domain of unknown function (DUF1902)
MLKPKVWVAESGGLATRADRLEELAEKLKVAIPELLPVNGVSFEPDYLRFTIEAPRSEYTNVDT